MKELTLFIFGAMLFIGLLPLIIAFAGIGLASLFGCTLSGPEAKACLVMGVDIGPLMNMMMMMHWLGILGLPIAGLGTLGLLVRGVVLFIVHLRS